MNIRPIGERVVIKPMQKEEKTQSGILLPDSAQEKPIEGEVVAVGPGRINEKASAYRWKLRLATWLFSPNLLAPT